MRKLILVLLIFILTTGMSFAGDSLSYFKQELDYRLGTSSQPPDSVKTRFINDSFRWLVSKVQNEAPCIEKKDTIVLQVNVIEYSLNSDALTRCIEAVHEIRNRRSALDYIPVYDVGKGFSESQTKSVKVSQAGRGIIFDPKPSLADTVIVWYNAVANILSGSGDTTYVPYEYREAAIYYAMGLCHLRTTDYSEATWCFSFADQLADQTILKLKNQRYNIIIAPVIM